MQLPMYFSPLTFIVLWSLKRLINRQGICTSVVNEAKTRVYVPPLKAKQQQKKRYCFDILV